MNLTLDKAMQADENMKSLGPKCHDKLEMAAFDDCLKLYDYIIYRLKKNVDPNKMYSQFDTQTWLSATLTDLETCQAGFIELGVTKNVLPLMHSENADIVVAHDGSGQYKTVAAGVSAAKSRSGSGRLVIYVKADTYNENIEISSKYIMLVGDGIGKTIITGSRSVGGCSTTFNSATVESSAKNLVMLCNAAVDGDGFICRGITFRNIAGAKNEQAVALRSGSDLSVFYQL
ncbi:hypothetical protein AgCh_034241 [Apium graveolens]